MTHAQALAAAKANQIRAHRELASTIEALQVRLTPDYIVSHALRGVKGKSAEIADGAIQAVKERPAAVSGAAAAAALFLARGPIMAAFNKFRNRSSEDEQDADTASAEPIAPAPGAESKEQHDDDRNRKPARGAGRKPRGARAGKREDERERGVRISAGEDQRSLPGGAPAGA
ncbi:hypothetical protein [Allosphingosinicella indica]|uniref:hypothetical protein n=1 Tax=Allosphingosinicella indica TaxID=941907 RepID=UPI00155F74D0|nr:hypothetical protein [Allosphingosinicella indica]